MSERLWILKTRPAKGTRINTMDNATADLMGEILARICAVFGETAVHGDTMSLKVLAEKFITASAVETFSAKFRIIGDDSLADAEALDFGANGSNLTYCFVARNERELCQEFTLVDVQIGAADTGSLDLDQNIVGTKLWKRDVYNGKHLRLGVPGQRIQRQQQLPSASSHRIQCGVIELWSLYSAILEPSPLI